MTNLNLDESMVEPEAAATISKHRLICPRLSMVFFREFDNEYVCTNEVRLLSRNVTAFSSINSSIRRELAAYLQSSR